MTVGARGNLFRLLVSILGTMHGVRTGGTWRSRLLSKDAGTFTKPWKQRSTCAGKGMLRE